jgi:hypothetical protein
MPVGDRVIRAVAQTIVCATEIRGKQKQWLATVERVSASGSILSSPSGVSTPESVSRSIALPVESWRLFRFVVRSFSAAPASG